jgi:hypothetical protein
MEADCQPKVPLSWIFLQSPYRSEILRLTEECKCGLTEGRCRCQALNTVTRACFCREQVSLSIYTQFLYFVMVDGRAKLLYCKVLMKPLASGYVSVFETSCLI